jgi:preprotein translocase subunit YajC
VKSSSPNTPSTWLILLCPHTLASQQTCHHSAFSVLAVRISCRVLAVFMFRKQKRRMEKSVNTYSRIKYFLTNKIFWLQVMYRYIRTYDFHCKIVTITCFFIACAALWWKSMIFIILSFLETVHDIVQYRCCIFLLLNRLLRIRLKRKNSLLSYVREGEKVHCECIM